MSQEREAVRAWAASQWNEPVEVVSFRRKRFRVNLPNRTGFGTLSIAMKILYILSIPLYLPYGFVWYVLDNFDVARPNWPTRAGTLSVRGMIPYGQAVDFLDLLKKCPKNSWVVFSRSNIAFLEAGFDQRNPVPFWQSGPEVNVELALGWEEGVLRIYWPGNGMAVLKLSEDEDVVVKNYALLHGAGWSRFA